MTFRASFLPGLIMMLAWVCLSGCTPSGSSPLDEQKEPHFLGGKSRVIARDYKGAIECFEKALQVNPKSASAHFELACLYEDREDDPSAAIYHYKHYLQLRPKAENADLMKQRILICKQALAESVSLGPVTDKIQRQVEQTAEENKRLTEANKRLKEDLEKWSSYAARLETLTNPALTQPAVSGRVALSRVEAPAQVAFRTPNASAGTGAAQASAALGNRTHIVKAGETPTQIAKKYGVKLEALMAANPSLNARRLKVGQTLRIPGS